ncbi:RNA-directed DNA polymerase, eukaryota [Tanacetum coccineum]
MDSFRKEALVNFLTDPLERRSTLADILVFGWVGGKHACVDLTGVSPLVGLRDNGFIAGQAALKAESSKVAKHEKACLENQHVFIPFAFDTFGFLAPEAEEFLNRVQRVVQTKLNDSVESDTTSYRNVAKNFDQNAQSVLHYGLNTLGANIGKSMDDGADRDRSSYARAMVELRADIELKDTLVVAIPKFMGEGYNMSTIRVEWDYLDDVLNSFGFGSKWRSWIRGSLISGKASILVNGSPTSEFQFHRGLKQGDPLAPFLFILIMESLHLSFSRAVEAGIFTGIGISYSLTISHLFYADDAVFIGLSINVKKSQLLGIGISDSIVSEAAKSLGCSIMKTPFKYLGIPVGGNMSLIKAWDESIVKLKRRLSKWKLKTLSIGGRLTLLKSVLGSTPIYNMSLFKVPKSVLHSMESLRRNFFNGIQEGDKKIAWVKWPMVLASKKHGGLGVSSFYALNRGLLFKWVWRYISQDNSLWARVISALHGSSSQVLSASFSSLWKSILNEVKSLKAQGVDLISHCKIRVGNGMNTSFWNDCWIGDSMLKHLFPRLFALETIKDISVADKFRVPITCSFRRPVRGGLEAQQLDHLMGLIESTLLSNSEDRWVWDLNGDGVFRVKDVRNLLDETFLPKADTPTRWIKCIPIKVNVFVWKALQDRLPTRSNLVRRNILIDSLSCPICDGEPEDSSHLFFRCCLARDVTRLVCRWWDLDFHSFNSYTDWQGWFKQLRLGAKSKEVLEGVFYVSWWSLWNFRNHLLFADSNPRKDAIFDEIVLRSFNWCLARGNRTLNWVSWLQHPHLISM